MRRSEVPVAATGPLRAFAEAQMLEPIDFHLARRMAALCRESDPRAELAFALTCRELRLGSVCLDVTTAHELTSGAAIDDGLLHEEAEQLPWPAPDEWLGVLAASPAVAAPDGPGRPFRLAGSLLYLDRFFAEERFVEDALMHRRNLPPTPVSPDALAAALGESARPADPQHDAIRAALTNATTVITGGPGTGKTTTVAKILRGLRNPARPPLVALAAPTGKAATRLESSVREALGEDPGLRLVSSTLHKLLEIVPGRERRVRTRENPLPHDVVVVDETSMVSLTLMSWLLDAVADDTRLILIGDPDQLESVEAGAVLADIASQTTALASGSGSVVVRLEHNWRSNEEINQLSAAVRAGAADEVLALLTSGESCTLTTFDGTQPLTQFPRLTEDLLTCATAVRGAALAGDGARANRELERHRLLCAHREGPFGVGHWSHAARSWLSGQLDGYAASLTWAGQPLLITRSSEALSNGDTGVVVVRDGRLLACMDRAGGLLWRDPLALDDATDLHAMTIHKAQGSQFEDVSVILPPVGSPLLTRQLLYTAMTRAKRGLRLYGTPEALVQAVNTPARRASGLGRR